VLASQAYGTGKPPYLEVYASVVTSGRPANFETYFAPIDKHFAVSVFSPRQGQFATVFADITQRKEAERQIVLLNQVYALLSHINEAIVRISDRQTLFEESCRIAAEYGHLQMAWIGLLDRTTNEVRPAAWAGHEDGYLTKLGSALQLTPSSQEPSVKAIREAKVVICADIAQDPSTEAWRDAALARGYRSLMALPLKQGMVTVGALVVYAKEPHYFSAIVTESLIEVATDLSFALELFERNRQREIEQQQLRLQHSALEAAANAIMITDRQGVILWVNDAFTRLAGFARTEVIGRSPRLLKSGAHSPEFYRSLWHTVVAGSVWQGSLTNRRKDGTLYDEEMTITPVRSHKGDITHFIAIKQDVTERKKLEQQFLRAQRMQSIGLLAGGLAHDLNNMLAPVLMALPLLKQGLDIETRDHIIDTLEQSVKRGANVVQQVLTFARGVEVQRVPVQLKHLVREMARIAEETFPRDISIRSNLPADLWPFLGDPTQIHQVLLNLAVNARDSMPEGGQLSFTARNVESRESRQFLGFAIPPGRYVSVSVADTGTGIRPEVLERIFEPFFTTKPAGKGTGLGLSTVLGIVKSHGGLVEVQSRLGAGSIFTVYLAAAPTEPTPENSPQKSAPHQGRGETILVVDDEASIAEVAQSILEASGYKVITARDGKQGLSKLTQPGNEIKAILTDIMMPIMDGLALIRSARQLNLQLPIIVMTGLMNHPNEEDRAAQLQELGIQHILRKPFHAEELLARLYQALRGQ
ncbi:MAG TPA: PAS domain S-box protein, partial [Clostridia bacterium]|nr:PAS domain S-box protein [Clostridia bacterium]